MKSMTAVLAFFLFSGVSYAAVHQAQIQGRWEFVTLTGDTQYQLDQMGQSTLSTVLLQNGNQLSNIPLFTTDYFDADQISDNNVTAAGTMDSDCNVTITFTVGNKGNSSQPVFTYTYTGILHEGPPTTLRGTYTTTVGSAYSNGSGNFEATFFPNFTGAVYEGMLDGPDTGTGPTNVPIRLVPTTNSNFSLSGTVEVPQLTEGHGNACFSGTLTMVSGQAEKSSHAAGVGMEIFAADTLGRRLWLNGYSVQPDGISPAAAGELYDPGTPLPTDLANTGTNNQYVTIYGVSGGPCDGFGGGDAPLHVIAKHEHRRFHHGPRQQKR